MGGELELKFRLDAAAIERLRKAGFTPESAARSAPLASAYYDTPDGDLAAARVALRVRRTPEGWVQTVKAEGASAFERFEFEAPVSTEHPERAALPAPDTAPGAVVHRHFERLEPLFVTDFIRTAWAVRPTGALEIELAADTGEIRAHDRTEPIAELEAERKRGSALAFWHWARRFAARHRLRLTYATKNERGLRLAGRLPAIAPPVKAGAVAPAGDLTAGQAAAQVVHECVAHFTANVGPLLQGEDPSAAHQARVALRRLRSAIRFFALPEADPRWAELDARAKALAESIGRLRDADVLAAGEAAAFAAGLPDDPAARALTDALAAMRERDRPLAREAAAGVEATRLVLGVSYLAERCAQPARRTRAAAMSPPGVAALSRSGAAALSRSGADNAADSGPAAGNGVDSPAGVGNAAADALQALRSQPFERFAAQRIVALLSRLARRARRARSAEDWHRVRIAAKNTRYALEFSASALPKRKRTRRATERLARLQGLLGEAQDAAVSVQVAERALAGHPDRALAARSAALFEGWAARGRHADSGRAHGKAKRLVEKLRAELRHLKAVGARADNAAERSPGTPHDSASA